MDTLEIVLLVGGVALVGGAVFPFLVFLTAKLWRYGSLTAEERYRRKNRGS